MEAYLWVVKREVRELFRRGLKLHAYRVLVCWGRMPCCNTKSRGVQLCWW